MAKSETSQPVGPIEFATYDEASIDRYSPAITKAALRKEIVSALAMANASRFWTPESRTGAQHVADYLCGMFKIEPVKEQT